MCKQTNDCGNFSIIRRHVLRTFVPVWQLVFSGSLLCQKDKYWLGFSVLGRATVLMCSGVK